MNNTERYIDAICGEGKVFKDDMRDYFKKSIFEIIELSDGSLFELSKEHIETRFCFSFDEYSDCHAGTHTIQDANDMASNVGFEYFLDENLKGLKSSIERLKEDDELYLCVKYYRGPKNIVAYTSFQDAQVLGKLCEADRKLIIEAKERQIANMEKRCKTWWKRYGKEKLHPWTYSCWD